MRLFVVAAFGAVVGPLAELAHWYAGVWELRDGAALPLWISLVYFLALLGAGFVFRGAERRWDLPSRPAKLSLWCELVLLVALFSAPPLLHSQEIVLTFVAASYLGARLLAAREPGDLSVALTIGLTDLVLEGALVWAGFFRYTSASHAPLPLWLPFLWGGLGLTLRRLFFLIDRLPRERD